MIPFAIYDVGHTGGSGSRSLQASTDNKERKHKARTTRSGAPCFDVVVPKLKLRMSV